MGALILTETSDIGTNHPKAICMAVIASLTFNVVIGSIFGPPGVLLKPMREHLGASTEMVSLGSLAVIIGSAICAPQTGALAARRSLREMLMGAAVLLSAG